MYIEDRLFSENTGETLYSVLLNKDEYNLFSVFQRKFLPRIELSPKIWEKTPELEKWAKGIEAASENSGKKLVRVPRLKRTPY